MKPIPKVAQPSVLVIDDDQDLTTMLVEFLEQEAFSINTADSLRDGARMISDIGPQLVILDVMLPDGSGLDLLRQLRARGEMVRVLLLTARGDPADRVLGLELGADDYLVKPFEPRELLARLRALLRRPETLTNSTLLLGSLELDTKRRVVTVRGSPILLTGTEFGLLHALLGKNGQVCTRDDLSQLALGRNAQLHDRSIDTHISNLRRKLSGSLIAIDSVRGAGYVLTEQDSSQ